MHDNNGDKVVTKRLLRYSLPARIWNRLRVPLAMIAPGAGPWAAGHGARRIHQTVCSCSLVTIRDEESADFLETYCRVPKEKLQVTSDLVLALSLIDIPPSSFIAVEKTLGPKNKKRIGLHLEVLTKQPELIRRFMELPIFRASEIWKEWAFFFFFDNTGEDSDVLRRMAINTPFERVPIVLMEDHWQTAALISSCDAVLTTKLHVGITASAFGIPCFGYSFHSKTARFYRQIGREEFQINWDSHSMGIIDSWLMDFFKNHDCKIEKNTKLDAARVTARKNLSLLDNFIELRLGRSPKENEE